MNFINHSRTGIKIYTFSDYRRDFAWKETPRINDGATLGQHQAQHAVELQVLINRHGAEGTLNSLRYLLWDSRYGDKWDGTILSPQQPSPPAFLNTTSVVITHHRDKRLVDLKAVRQPYLNAIEHMGGESLNEDNAPEIGLQIGAALINGLATGLAALGPVGALPGGGVLGVGSILLAVLGAAKAPPPPPPDALEIAAIVKKVVERELDIEDAKDAATAFAIAIEDLLHEGEMVQREIGQENDKLTKRQRDRIEKVVERHVSSGGVGTLRYSVEHLQHHPEIAKWILPSYIDGIGAYLAFRRLDILIQALPDDLSSQPKISVTDVNDYLEYVKKQRDALVAAYDAYEAHVAEKVKQSGLHETPLAQEFGELVTRSMFGTSNLNAIHTARGDLNVMIAQLEHDVKSGTTKNFWSAST